MKNLAPWIISLVFVVWLVAKMIPPKPGPGFDSAGFGRLPALVDGRLMPMDCTRLTNPPTISRRNLLKWADDGTRRS